MKSSPKKEPKQSAQPTTVAMPLGAINYVMIALGVFVIALSYAGMYLERSVDGFFSLNISPFLLVGSYLWIIVAILYRGKSSGKG